MTAEIILVIDDAAEMRDLIANLLLRPQGYTVLTAEDGPHGLALARTEQPHLIITDMMMPGLTGLELIQQLRQQRLATPVILMTAEGSERLVQHALRAGVSDYLVKPFDGEELLAAVRRGLAEAQTTHDHAALRAENTVLMRRLIGLKTLIGVGHDVVSLLDLGQTLTRIVDVAVALATAEEGALMLLDERTHELVMRATRNLDDPLTRTLRLPFADSLAGQVVRTGQPIIISQATPHKIASQYLVHALIYVPLLVHGRVIGVLGVDNRQAGRAFTEDHLHMLQALADYAAIAIENARLFAHTEAERAKLETVLKETEDGVVVVGPDQRIMLINPSACEALGVEAANVTGRSLTQAIVNPQVRELFATRARGGEIQLEDGRVFNAHLTPIAEVGDALVMQDITHLKRLDRIKSEFVTTVSHDLRSPLTAILGYVDLIQRAGSVNEAQADFIRRVRSSVQIINDLITDLLDLGRIEAGFDSQKEIVSLNHLLHLAADTLHPNVETKHQTFELLLPDEPLSVWGNLMRLRQMFGNLMENAIKYTPPNGTVRVLALAEGEQIIVMITDTGIGIPPVDQPYIFDKFYRAASVRAEYVGTGLGLSIVKSIVESHGGRIWLDSKIGQGSTFTVVMPKHQEGGKEA